MLRLAFLIVLVVSAADWPRFRGPGGSGIADAAVPVDFGPERNLRWKADLPGPGNSSPVVAAGKLFVQSAATDGSGRFLTAFDAQTGRRIWQRECAGRTVRVHRKNSLASSTPAADAQCVVALFWDGEAIELAAFAHDGRPLWQRNLGPFHAEHGAGLSPIIAAGRVFVANDQDDGSHFLALDAASGKPVWQKERSAFRACYSTPYVRDAGGRAEIVVTSTAGITAYDPAKGNSLWEYPWGGDDGGEALRTVASPVEADGVIFAHAGNGAGNSHLIAIRPGAGPRPQLLWERKNKGGPYVASAVVTGGRLFTVSDRGIAGCYDADTGREVWTERLGGSFAASLILAGDKIYTSAEDGTVSVYNATPQFSLAARNALAEPIIATPAAADGRLFVRTRQRLYCFGVGEP